MDIHLSINLVIKFYLVKKAANKSAEVKRKNWPRASLSPTQTRKNDNFSANKENAPFFQHRPHSNINKDWSKIWKSDHKILVNCQNLLSRQHSVIRRSKVKLVIKVKYVVPQLRYSETDSDLSKKSLWSIHTSLFFPLSVGIPSFLPFAHLSFSFLPFTRTIYIYIYIYIYTYICVCMYIFIFEFLLVLYDSRGVGKTK